MNENQTPQDQTPQDQNTPAAPQYYRQPQLAEAQPAPDAAVTNPSQGYVQAGYAAQTPENPISALTIVGFIMAFVMPLVGLILSIIALKGAKARNEEGSRLALAGIIIGAVFTALTLLYIIFVMGTVVWFGSINNF
ncbi:DUF4190 domain-containing protein [Canibacter zhoujuaniae]|uniref:DUF4190 domain-containing protein n=1 Tax=Canibacter zhoujuaniae TaxID=2708343 RepID=UPI001422D779|nr:DUF4190 domain-containing protein [Canibacter zhoujuaniae]